MWRWRPARQPAPWPAGIRWATSDDAPAIASLFHRAWLSAHAHLLQPGSETLCTLKSFERRLSSCLFEEDAALVQSRRKARPTALVVQRDDTICGFAVVSAGARLEHIYVDSSVRGNGIGAQLLATAESVMLHERDCTCGHLVVAARNLRAKRFYEKHAWIVTDRPPSQNTAANWVPLHPEDLQLPPGGLTGAELAATRIACTHYKKFLGYDGNPNDGAPSSLPAGMRQADEK